jgi:hypothetical protein
MKISAPKSPWKQAQMFDLPIGNHGHIRTIIGDTVENLTCRVFGGVRHKTQSTADYCPDISIPAARPILYLECKAAGLSNQTFVYEGRLEKDRIFSKANELLYVIWWHKLATKTIQTEGELRSKLLESFRGLYIIRFKYIDQLAKAIPATPLNSHYGHSDTNKLYGSGIRLPLKLFHTVPHTFIPL